MQAVTTSSSLHQEIVKTMYQSLLLTGDWHQFIGLHTEILYAHQLRYFLFERHSYFFKHNHEILSLLILSGALPRGRVGKSQSPLSRSG